VRDRQDVRRTRLARQREKEKVASTCKEVRTLVQELEKLRDILSAEQKEKLAELKDERQDRVR
jgi:hypothetical protein